MNVLATDRRNQRQGARRILIAGLVAWLSFIVQPCVMAAPLAGTAGSAGFDLSSDTHHGSGMPTDECLHCVDVGSTRGLATGACDDVSIASASPKTNSLDNFENSWTPAIAFSIIPDIRQIVPRSVGMPEAAELLPRTVPLTIAYCVYLE
jgi:hypothetical protein